MPRRSRGTSAKGSQGAVPTQQMQPPKAPTGMAYGAHAESVEAQKAVPLPQAPPPPSGAPPSAPGGGGGDGANPMDKAMQLAQMMPAINGGLAAPSARPDEPVQSGLFNGPGAGPEALATYTPNVSDVYRRLALTNGDPDMAALAEIAAGYGL